jgi:hypothetical protein
MFSEIDAIKIVPKALKIVPFFLNLPLSVEFLFFEIGLRARITCQAT